MKKITLRKQLKDPIFAAWMKRQPRKDTNPPYKNWRIFVQKKKNGPWARVDAFEYQTALKWVMSHLDDYHDIALTSKLYTFRPPIVTAKGSGTRRFHKPEAPGHDWCPFCRRMTRWRRFARHHNMKSYYCGEDLQCEICGAPRKFQKQKEWRW